MADTQSVKRAAKAPISMHPAFPAIVALWFAGLVGLGSLVLPAALFERLVTVTGVAALVPPAAPPLGFTARAAIAVAGALGGALAGLMLARRVARSHMPQPEPCDLNRARTRECRPISAHDELGEEGLGWPEAMPVGRGRRLPAVESGPGSYPDGVARQEMHKADADVAAEMDPERAEENWQSGDFGRYAPLQRTATANDDEVSDFVEDAPFAQQGEVPAAWETVEADADFQTPAPQLAVMEPGRGQADAPRSIHDRPLDELGLVQLAGRLGAAIETRRARKALRSAAAAAPSAMPTNFEAAGADDAARAIADFFGAATDTPQHSEAVEREPRRPLAPLSLRTLQIDDDDEEEDDDPAFARSFSLPLSGLANGHGLSAADTIEEEDGPDGDEIDEREYSSLLAMKNPFSRHEEFVRIDEPEPESGVCEPTASHPTAAEVSWAETAATPLREQAAAASEWPDAVPENEPDYAAFGALPATPRDPASTERDLRAALAALQRINGAA